MSDSRLLLEFKFADYGTSFDPAPDTLVLDVGMKMAPGVIDHHHPEAEAECAASLIAKYPGLVLDHIRPPVPPADRPLTIITHRLPDFDALASIFLSLRLIETGRFDPAMTALAAYTKTVDSSTLRPDIDLAATPYAVLRALFAGARKSEDEMNRDRLDEGLKFMRFLHARASEGMDIVENNRLFRGIDRYERAVRKVGEDHQYYLSDALRSPKFSLSLPRTDDSGRKTVDGLSVENPHCFLLKEWARRDATHAPGGRGFSFVMARYGASRFILGVDPAAGVSLRGLGAILNEKETARRTEREYPPGPPWYEGNNPFFGYRIVDSPRDDSRLDPAEVLAAVLAFGRGLRSSA